MREYYELLRATSRTFAVGIEALPGSLRDAVTLAYLVLRVSDYFEDSPTLSSEEKRRALERWARLVETAGAPADPAEIEALSAAVSSHDTGVPDRLAALKAESILRGLALLPPQLLGPIREHAVRTTRGMVRWTMRGDDFPDESALDDYMFEVAGRVGLLLTDVFCAHSPAVRARRDELLRSAVSFGLGLQTVNVIRGLHEDPDRGWTYIPRHLVPPDFAEGGTGGDLRSLERDSQLRILDFLVSKAGTHIGDALEYCQTLPRRQRGIRVFCIIPALLALRTAEASLGNPRTFTDPVKVSRKDVRRIVLATRLLFFSNGWIEGEKRSARKLAESCGAATR
jgi:farnesyl-diphosphate farnesyltransferase